MHSHTKTSRGTDACANTNRQALIQTHKCEGTITGIDTPMNTLKFISKCSLIYVQKDVHILNEQKVPIYGCAFGELFESAYIKHILMGISVHVCTHTHPKDSDPDVLIESCKHVHSSSPSPSASFFCLWDFTSNCMLSFASGPLHRMFLLLKCLPPLPLPLLIFESCMYVCIMNVCISSSGTPP